MIISLVSTKNIDACRRLSNAGFPISLGLLLVPMVVINHLDKLFVRNDAAAIGNELEIGDGENLTFSFAELLQNAEELFRMGPHPSEIISGYTKAINKTIEILDELVEKASESMDVRSNSLVMRMLYARSSQMHASRYVQKNAANFNVDNVRVAKLLGGGLPNSTVVQEWF